MEPATAEARVTRRQAAWIVAAGAAWMTAGRNGTADDATGDLPIVDTHQHLWDLDAQRLPWLEGAAAVLRRSYRSNDYAEATQGLNVVSAVYMEVDVAPEQHVDEAERILRLCRSGTSPTRAAVIGGRPASPDFAAYIRRFRDAPEIKGVRQVLHGATPAGFCLGDEFVQGIQALGEAGLSFDLCVRPGELDDAAALVAKCPGTRFILDHCGNADPIAFQKKNPGKPSHDPIAWSRSIDALARRPNVICKISGIVAKAPKDYAPDDLAPIVNHCLDQFGPERVVFGGDWPVCLLGSSYRGWVEALRAIVSNRPEAERKKLWSGNARKHYGLLA